jgi:putative DNA primase/helicase
MTIEELTQQYVNVPKELKDLRRWVCFKVEGTNNGKTTKRPYNPLNGVLARVNNSLTWSTFDIAIKGCLKYNCHGIGFVLGDGIFGIDLDNHVNENGEMDMTPSEFKELADEFITKLNSYAETSQSGNGIHIICQGKLPKGARRKGCIEMYDSDRYFAFTGNVINNVPIYNREEEVKELWEKYVNVKNASNFNSNSNFYTSNPNCEGLKLTDEEIIDTAINSANGNVFYKYYHDGDLSMDKNDHSAADMAFTNLLAFWCNKDIEQMDRIFRNSALMRDKWDEKRGALTYGEITLNRACDTVINGYVKPKPVEGKLSIGNNNDDNKMNLDENGEPIFRIKKIFGSYPYTDTGNATRFYDYFGELFKYNVTDNHFMYWTGKTWISDFKGIIRKYANKFIDILKDEEKRIEENIEKLKSNPDENAKKIADLEEVLKAAKKNSNRVANKAGKDAMLYEFQSLKDVPIQSSEFDKNDYLLNTASGIVNLKTGEISDFDKDLLLSKNTNTEVSYETPEVWLKFLYSVFDNGNDKDTQDMILSLQTCLGYSISGSTKEEVMFLLYGGGSNGKTTLTEAICQIIGDYSDTVKSDTLMQQKVVNNTVSYTLAKLRKVRFVQTGETDEGGKLAEGQVKIMTGSDTIAARFAYGREFSYKPNFKIWMSTNNKPIIVGQDDGIWRRMFMFPFLNSFTGDKKDKDLGDKLRREYPKILGWIIKGFLRYLELGDLYETQKQKDAKKSYKEKMDVIAQFIEKECLIGEGYQTECKVLYAHYKNWAKDNIEFPHKESKFNENMIKKGYEMFINSNGRRFYKNIRINGVEIADTRRGEVRYE